MTNNNKKFLLITAIFFSLVTTTFLQIKNISKAEGCEFTIYKTYAQTESPTPTADKYSIKQPTSTSPRQLELSTVDTNGQTATKNLMYCLPRNFFIKISLPDDATNQVAYDANLRSWIGNEDYLATEQVYDAGSMYESCTNFTSNSTTDKPSVVGANTDCTSGIYKWKRLVQNAVYIYIPNIITGVPNTPENTLSKLEFVHSNTPPITPPPTTTTDTSVQTISIGIVLFITVLTIKQFRFNQ